MENLLKTIIEQLNLIYSARTASASKSATKHSVELIKANSLGQWQVLEKAYVDQKIPKGSCDCGAHKEGTEMHSDWCGGLKAGAGTPKATLPELDPMKIDHNYKSLKDVHAKHGMPGVEKLIRHHGANGSPAGYYNTHFHPALHDELNSIVGRSDKNDSEPDVNGGSTQTGHRPTIYDDVRAKADPAIQKHIEDTYKKAWAPAIYDPNDTEVLNAEQEHEDAVVQRGIDHFKKVHNIKD